MSVTGFFHAGVTVSDMDRSLAFYSTVLGYLRRTIAPRLFGDSVERDAQPAFSVAASLTEMAVYGDAARDRITAAIDALG